LPIAKAKLLWELVSFFCVVLALFIIRKHFIFKNIEFIAIIALTFGFAPLYMNFVWGQAYAFLLLLQTLTFVFWMDRRTYAASLTVALMLAFKGYGVIFLLLALFQREWRLVIYGLVNYIALVIASAIVIGIDPWLTYVSSLVTVVTSVPPSATFQQNVQSLVSWFFVEDQFNPNPMFNSPSIVRPLLFVIMVSGIAGLYWFTRKRTFADRSIPFMVASIISVLTAPLLYDYHYVLFLIPIIACYRQLSLSATKSEFIGFGISLLLLSTKIPYYYPIFQNTWLGILGFPRVYGAVILAWLFYRILSRELKRTGGDLLAVSASQISAS
jgi:hypothetical protein